MNKLFIFPLLVFSFWPAVFCEDCHLRENARDLINVDYVSVFNNTNVDMIEVGMKERKRKFGRLLFNEDCSEKIKNTKLRAVLYKRSEGKPSELVDEMSKKARFRFEHLDPCAVYDVNVTIGNHEVGSYTVGPYYVRDDVQHPFLFSEDNQEYERRKGEIKTVTAYKDRAVIELGPVCAKMVMIHLREKQSNGTTHRLDQEKTTILNVTENMTPHKEVGTKLEVENLKPCTLYTVDIELWLHERSPIEGDFAKDQVFDFYTMPKYDENSKSEQRHLRREVIVVKSGNDPKLPKECYVQHGWNSNTTENNPGILKDQGESRIPQIAFGISILVILVATILACSLTVCQRKRGQREMKKLLPDSPSTPSPPVFKTIIPIEPDPETDKQTVVLLKYADLSRTY